MEENTKNTKHHNNDEDDGKLMEHNYDGIQELDNPPPRWIMALFYITIAFAIVYAAYYFWLDVGDTQDTEYVRKSESHDNKYQLANQSSDALVLLDDPNSIEEGKQIFTEMNCAACHGLLGEGNVIGPNITDEFTIHGCDFQSVFNIIKNGNPVKGMTAFKGQISDNKIQLVSSYVISLKGTKPVNAKEAQGEKCD